MFAHECDKRPACRPRRIFHRLTPKSRPFMVHQIFPSLQPSVRRYMDRYRLGTIHLATPMQTTRQDRHAVYHPRHYTGTKQGTPIPSTGTTSPLFAPAASIVFTYFMVRTADWVITDRPRPPLRDLRSSTSNHHHFIEPKWIRVMYYASSACFPFFCFRCFYVTCSSDSVSTPQAPFTLRPLAGFQVSASRVI